MAEVDGPVLAKSKPKVHVADQQVAKILSIFIRWAVFGFLCLGLGFWAGAQNAQLRWALRQPSDKQLLTSQGWRQDGTGVFYRWCLEQCHAPQMYGGGVLKVFEVKCVDRPCGDILMRFNVLNSKREMIDQIVLNEKGLHGETRRFMIEAQNPDAASLELAEFSARAKV
ncbi:hypothetical protein [Synechococcus sp. CS-1328]|uniref:hypothetical protein n=1 Tax=Synechococcus sp. CS-1328 TaxID=2847976 RepID=UPI00223B7D0B|nr:hypothetical protein [Synechococcus sp. CS-1328]MCT0224297.1 hypothetical protein [Synechococcus sp. CS-1328]